MSDQPRTTQEVINKILTEKQFAAIKGTERIVARLPQMMHLFIQGISKVEADHEFKQEERAEEWRAEVNSGLLDFRMSVKDALNQFVSALRTEHLDVRTICSDVSREAALRAKRLNRMLTLILIAVCIAPLADRALFWIWPERPPESHQTVTRLGLVPGTDGRLAAGESRPTN